MARPTPSGSLAPRHRSLRRALVLGLLLGVVPGGLPGPAAAQTPGEEIARAIPFRHVGPVGNRISAVVGVPGDLNTYYVGAASGGIWRSRDGGHSWEPVFDDHGVQSIGALAVAPSNPRVIWAGTGESKVRSNISHGAGVFRSTDGGESWTRMGLEESGRISRIRIHPTNPDIVYVAALGHLYGPQEQKGVFRTTDGGSSWERVLFTDPGTGPSDLWMHPTDPERLVAGMWTMHIRTWGRWSGGPEDGLYRTDDGGDTWTRLEGDGLPTGLMGRIGLTGSADDPDRVYALIETNSNRDFAPLDEHEGVLWRSDDFGDSWSMINADHTLVQRPHYYSRALAAPDDADEVHFLATRHTVSRDGGRSVTRLGGGSGGDHHAMWIDPEMPERRIVGHDQGVSISTNRGLDWYRPLLPVAQMYHVATDDAVPYNLYGNRQDGPSTRGPSRVLYGGPIPVGEWRAVGGCETGWAVPDRENQVVWSGCYEGILDRHDLATRTSRRVSVWPENPEGWPAGELRYRFQWTFPIHLSPHDPETVYVGSQHVHRTRDGGQSWEVISPDLSTGLDSLQRKTGGLTPDDASPTYAAVVFALAESPREPGTLYAGTNDGRLHRTRDGGRSWTDLTDRIPGLPPLATVSSIEPSRHAPGTVYLAVDAHQLGDFRPLLWVSRDRGDSWTPIVRGIPEGPLSYTHVLREDPVRPGLLYAGTENGLYLSEDDGTSWRRFPGNLPPAPVHWVEVQPRFNDLVVATYGRGFWIADDITPLQRSELVDRDGPVLFPPRPAYRWVPTESPFSQPGDPAAGENGPLGATLTYRLPDAASEVTLEILDQDGIRVAALSDPPRSAGVHRVEWDLSHTPSRTPRIRTTPLEHSHVSLGREGFRGPPDGGRVRPTAVPGRYVVRLAVDGDQRTAPLEVLPDPSSTGSAAGRQAQLEMALRLRDEVDGVAALIDEIEGLRVGSAASLEALPANADDARESLLALGTDLEALESTLYDLRLSGGSAGQDALRWPRGLYARLTSLSGYIGGTDHGPTDQAREVHRRLQAQLNDARVAMETIRSGPLATANARLRALGLPGVSEVAGAEGGDGAPPPP